MNNKKHSLKSWILATRPWSFPASTMPVLVTLTYLHWLECDVNWGIGFWTLINIILFHAAANTWSDYFDYKKGVDRSDTIGGMSITNGEFEACEIRKLSIILLILSSLSGLLLVCCTGFPTLYFGLAGCALILLYPWLKYHALGDIDIFATFAILPVLGTSFVATGSFYLQAMWLTVPIGLITVGILHINNTRDIEHDRRAGITTFAMLAGRRISTAIYCFEVLFPFLWVVASAHKGLFPWWSMIVFVAIIPAIKNVAKALQFPSKGAVVLFGVDELTAKLQLLFSLLFALSFLIA